MAIKLCCLVTCYCVLEYCCSVTHSCHCQDPCGGVFSCFQDGPGTTDCHARHLLLVLSQRCHSPVLVGLGYAVPEDTNHFKTKTQNMHINDVLT